MRNLALLFKRAVWLFFFKKKHPVVDLTTSQELVVPARLRVAVQVPGHRSSSATALSGLLALVAT